MLFFALLFLLAHDAIYGCLPASPQLESLNCIICNLPAPLFLQRPQACIIGAECSRNALSCAVGVQISLHRESKGSSGVYECIAQDVTNQDGRIGNLLPASKTILPGNYR